LPLNVTGSTFTYDTRRILERAIEYAMDPTQTMATSELRESHARVLNDLVITLVGAPPSEYVDIMMNMDPQTALAWIRERGDRFFGAGLLLDRLEQTPEETGVLYTLMMADDDFRVGAIIPGTAVHIIPGAAGFRQRVRITDDAIGVLNSSRGFWINPAVARFALASLEELLNRCQQSGDLSALERLAIQIARLQHTLPHCNNAHIGFVNQLAADLLAERQNVHRVAGGSSAVARQELAICVQEIRNNLLSRIFRFSTTDNEMHDEETTIRAAVMHRLIEGDPADRTFYGITAPMPLFYIPYLSGEFIASLGRYLRTSAMLPIWNALSAETRYALSGASREAISQQQLREVVTVGMRHLLPAYLSLSSTHDDARMREVLPHFFQERYGIVPRNINSHTMLIEALFDCGYLSDTRSSPRG
jgi:hypothetical protein